MPEYVILPLTSIIRTCFSGPKSPVISLRRVFVSTKPEGTTTSQRSSNQCHVAHPLVSRRRVIWLRCSAVTPFMTPLAESVQIMSCCGIYLSLALDSGEGIVSGCFSGSKKPARLSPVMLRSIAIFES